MEKRTVEKFQVRSEKDGKVYTAWHREEYIDVTNLASDGPEAIPSGIGEFTLADGRRLNVKDEAAEVFEIVITGDILRRISRQ